MFKAEERFFPHLATIVSSRKTPLRKELILSLMEKRTWVWELPSPAAQEHARVWSKSLSELRIDVILIDESLKVMVELLPLFSKAEKVEVALKELQSLVNPVEVLAESFRQKSLGKIKDMGDREILWRVGDLLLQALADFDAHLARLVTVMQVDEEFSVLFRTYLDRWSWFETALQAL